jgi:signal transduction histidine kinase
MTWRRVLIAAIVFAATGLTTIVIVSPYAASPAQEYIAVPSLLVLDLAAAIGIASSCCAAALIGRPSNAVIPCGITAAALLADAWIGHGLSPGFQALGFAAVPLLPSTIAFAPAAAGIERSGALIVSTRVLLGIGVAAAVASIVTYDPYLDLSCQRDCLQNPLLLANLPSVAPVFRLAESAACVASCLVAIRDFRKGYGARVILAATASAVAVSALRLVSLTFTPDNPQVPALRVLHAGVASCVLVAGAALAYELSRPFTARVRLDRLLRDLRAADELGLERCLRLAVGDETLTLAYRHPADPVLLIDTLGVPVAAGAVEADDHTDLSVAGQGVAVVSHRRGAFLGTALRAALGPASTLALDSERLRAATLYDLASRREASAKLIELGDREREQIEHNLHDGAQQGLLGSALALQLARFQAPSRGIDDALHELQDLAATVRRIAHGIHPATLAENGLAPALESLLDTTNDASVTLRVDRAVGRLDEAVEISAYEMVLEGLANANAHGARSAEVSVAIDDGGLRIDLTDNGPGGASQARGGGLEAIADRALALGGTFTITSPPGGPTTLRLLLPLAPSSNPSPQPSADAS